MANYPLQIVKAVSALPSTLSANTFYPVRVGQGYDLYLTDTTGNVAYKPNVSVSQITDTLPIAQGGTGATTVSQARSNLGFGNATLNNQEFDVVGSNLINRYSGFKFLEQNKTYSITVADAENMLQVYDNTIVNLPSGFPKLTTFTVFHCGSSADAKINVPSGSFIYHPATGLITTTTQLSLRAGETVELLNRGNGEYDVVGGSYLNRVSLQNIVTNSIKSGSASYKKGWRKLTTTLPSQAGEITLAHGVTTIETVQAKVTNSDGLIVFNNDIDPANQFYVRVNGANLVLGVTANSTKVFGKSITIYVGEEL